MSRIETGCEQPEQIQIGGICLTAVELAGLAEYEAANRQRAGVEDTQAKPENLQTIIFNGKGSTRRRFMLKRGTKPDPKTGIPPLTRVPHSHRACEEAVADSRKHDRKRMEDKLVWQLRIPVIPEDDETGFTEPPHDYNLGSDLIVQMEVESLPEGIYYEANGRMVTSIRELVYAKKGK